MHKFKFLSSLAVSFIFCSSLTADELMVFSSGPQEGPTKIFVKNLTTEVVTEIGEGLYPSLSADGAELTYLVQEGSQALQVVTKNLISGKVERWFKEAGLFFHPNYSGDGKLLAVSAPLQGKNQIVILNLEKLRSKTSTVEADKSYNLEPEDLEIIESEGHAYFPKLSSDGRYVLFHQSFKDSNNPGDRKASRKQVFIFDRYEGREKEAAKRLEKVTQDDEYCFEPAFSFDDRMISFVCRKSFDAEKKESKYSIEVVGPLPSKERQVLTSEPGYFLAPAFRSNGNLVYCGKNVFFERELKSGKFSENEREFLTGYESAYVPRFSGDTNIEITRLPDMPEARSSFALVASEESLFVLGGHIGERHKYDNTTITGRIDQFKNNEWTKLGELPTAIQGFEATIRSGKLYSFGGMTAEKREDQQYWPTSIDQIQECDIETGNCRILPEAKLKLPRSSYEAVDFAGMFILIGGSNTQATETPKDLATPLYEPLESISFEEGKIEPRVLPVGVPAPLRRGFASAKLTDGRVVIAGGMTEDRKFVSEVKIADFNSKDVWTSLPDLPVGFFAPALAHYQNKLYLLGGTVLFGGGSVILDISIIFMCLI